MPITPNPGSKLKLQKKWHIAQLAPIVYAITYTSL